MAEYEKIIDYEMYLTKEYKEIFDEEIRCTYELFNVLLEADKINNAKWQLKPERRSSTELICRVFNSLHASSRLVLCGMIVQGMALLRDVIECINHIKLFENDSGYRERWNNGAVFYPRDIVKRLNDLDIALPQLNNLYSSISKVYIHPSKGGVASHTINWHPLPGAQGVICL